jgi:uroporphyrinogen-III synthase
MGKPLEGRTVALAESRQLEDLARMLADEGATPLRYPLVAILDAPDRAPVVAWAHDLIAGKFGRVVLMTGEAVRRLTAVTEAEGCRDAFVAALGRTRTLSRGPKPVRALRELGLPAGDVSDAPTTDGVIATLARESLAGTTVGVAWHGEAVPALREAITAAGAAIAEVRPYVYAPAADADKVADLIAGLAGGRIDLAVFTSSPQVQRLFEVAEARGLTAELQAGLARTAVAAVGPLVAEALASRGARVDVCPDHGFVMRNLVRQIARDLERVRPR